ncbi:MAG TPA: stage II sporulation protein M [Anaeromyxobacteraceae bacterium]|nr:stage II sporulation protein M [Anaeromyxobacteraceae bacterium]
MTRARNVGAFVRAGRASWERLADLSARVDRGTLSLAEVEELDRLTRRAAGDLAHAQAAFPGSEVEGYLAQVNARAHAALGRRRRPGLAAVGRLYRQEAPEAFSRHRQALALAAALLVAGLGGGALAVAVDPAAASSLVPAEIRAAVAARQMWTESLLSAAPGFTGSAIARNNLAVVGLVFSLGLAFGVGTAALLFANGLVLGAVVVHAAQAGMGRPLLAFLAPHAPLELSALLVAGQAGFVLAGALLDPGEWPRGVLLALRGRRATRLLAVVIPALLAAAAVESTVSPAPGLPGAARAAVGLSLACALWLYLARPPRTATAAP